MSVVDGPVLRAHPELARELCDHLGVSLHDTEIKRFVATYVARELDKPAIRSARTINVGAEIARSWG